MRHFSRFSRSGLPPRSLGRALPIFSSPLDGAAVTASCPYPNVATLWPCGRNVERYGGAGDLHFITCSCYGRQPLLGTPRRRDLFLRVLEQVRKRYEFVVVGYVVMPEHVHLLISEPQKKNP